MRIWLANILGAVRIAFNLAGETSVMAPGPSRLRWEAGGLSPAG